MSAISSFGQDAFMGMPQELTQPALALVFGDGQLLPLEYTCHHCQGKKKNAAGADCPACEAKGVILTNQGRVLLAFLEKWRKHD